MIKDTELAVLTTVAMHADVSLPACDQMLHGLSICWLLKAMQHAAPLPCPGPQHHLQPGLTQRHAAAILPHVGLLLLLLRHSFHGSLGCQLLQLLPDSQVPLVEVVLI